MPEEREPTYLQDVGVPKEECPPAAFDLDREFGKGTTQRMEQALREHIDVFRRHVFGGAWHPYRLSHLVLFGRRPWDDETQNVSLMALRKEGRAKFEDHDYWRAAIESAFPYFILGGGQKFWNKKQEVGMREKLDVALDRLRQGEYPDGAMLQAALAWRALFGDRPWDDEANAKLINWMGHEIREGLRQHDDRYAAFHATYLRILQMHELRFTNDGGIEIIDAKPSLFGEQKPPLPEEKAF